MIENWYSLFAKHIDINLVSYKVDGGAYFWEVIDPNQLKYYYKNIIEQPWSNHFALILICLYERNLSPASVFNIVTSLNARFRGIFDEMDIQNMDLFNITCIDKYMKEEICINDSHNQRRMLIAHYSSVTFNLSKWINKISSEFSKKIQHYLLPELPFDNRDYKIYDLAKQITKKNRKNETSAITPILPAIRAESHFRWNQINRLKKCVDQLIEKINSSEFKVPLEFEYDESEYSEERLYFVLWDKPSFAIAHADQYSNTTFIQANTLSQRFDPENNEYFIEFLKAEKISDKSQGDGLWFFEIIEKGLMGKWDVGISEEDHKTKMDFLRQWGYSEETESSYPFYSANSGVLLPGVYISRTQEKAEGLLINVESLFWACTFARFAIDMITSSGARINEVLQISYDKECCITTVDTHSEPAKTSFIFRLVPKGRDELENYYVPQDIFRFMSELLVLLQKHYNSTNIPKVSFELSSRKHLFSDKRYIFQFNGMHIKDKTISSCIRFLMHGLIIQTTEGYPVVVKPHLLRHAFATHAVQSEKVPIDIVKEMLHQKDINVTNYYSEPTESQISKTINDLHESWITLIDIQQAIIRSPNELEEIYNDYRDKVGTMSKVVGGICTIDSVCPTKMACMGCAAKVPQPEFKDEIKAYYTWADESEKKFKNLGLELEAKKMKIAKNRARNELKEIEHIEKYKKDETYAQVVHVRKRK